MAVDLLSTAYQRYRRGFVRPEASKEPLSCCAGCGAFFASPVETWEFCPACTEARHTAEQPLRMAELAFDAGVQAATRRAAKTQEPPTDDPEATPIPERDRT